jgi:TP901 family phage tail tape measure protein
MAIELGRAYVPVLPDLKGFGAKLAAGMRAEGAAGAAIGGKVAGLAFMGAVGGVVLAGAGLAKLGDQFQDAYNKIRVGTGATGDALKALQDDFKAVARTGPESFDVVGGAIADLNTRLGLTGVPLQDVTRQILDLSRITGTDVSQNIVSLTRFLGDAGVESSDFATAIDSVFRASQATGPSVSTLADLMVRFGAPLRQFGFSFEESATMLGKFEKEGVNTQLVMGSLRIALGKFSKAGLDPKEALLETMDAIKNAGSAAEANQIAFETFGARAGADMAAAIREGRFELGDLFEQVSSGEETIQQASDDTKTYGERMQELGNKLKVALEPAAIKVLEGIANIVESSTPLIETLGVAVGGIATAFAAIPGPVFVVAGAIATAVVTILTISKAFGAVQAAWTALSAVFALNPIVLAIIAIIAVIALLVIHWDTIKESVAKAWDWIVEKTQIAWDWLKGFFERFWPIILGIATGGIGLVVALIVQNWDTIKAKTVEIWHSIQDTFWSVWETIKAWVTEKVDAIRDKITGAFETAKNTLTGILDGIRNAVGGAFDWVRDRANDVKNAIGTVADKFTTVKDAIGGAVFSAAGFVANFVDLVKQKLTELKDWVSQNAGKILGPFEGIARTVGGFLGGTVGKLFRASGGGVPAGQPTMVGETGPELVTFTGNANVMSATATRRMFESIVAANGASGGGVTVNGPLVNLSDVTIRSDDDITLLSRELAKDINRRARALGEPVALTGARA